MAIEMGDYFDFLGTSDLAPGVGLSAYIFIGIGVLVTIIAFFGCCAACTDNACMMYTFASLMAIILIAEVGVAIAAFVQRRSNRFCIRCDEEWLEKLQRC